LSTITKLKNTLFKLAARNLSFKSRILIAKSLILFHIWYTAYILSPRKKQISKTNDLMIFWIKGNSKILPKYATYQLSYEKGGLQTPIVGNMLEARMITT
ncbi:27227_t:CDS:1, partial [Dentiscutata erythropus]